MVGEPNYWRGTRLAELGCGILLFMSTAQPVQGAARGRAAGWQGRRRDLLLLICSACKCLLAVLIFAKRLRPVVDFLFLPSKSPPAGTQQRFLLCFHTIRPRHPSIHPSIQRCTLESIVLVFGLWEELGLPVENPRIYWENTRVRWEKSGVLTAAAAACPPRCCCHWKCPRHHK